MLPHHRVHVRRARRKGHRATSSVRSCSALKTTFRSGMARRGDVWFRTTQAGRLDKVRSVRDAEAVRRGRPAARVRHATVICSPLPDDDLTDLYDAAFRVWVPLVTAVL